MGEAGRSLAETPTWSVATVTTLMVAACFLVERALSRFAKWLRKTKRKAMLAALEKIREELMLLGVISLLLSQSAHWISEICVPSSVFSSKFYICSEKDFDRFVHLEEGNQTSVMNHISGSNAAHVCGEGHEPFVSYEGLEQLHRFLFILGITHVLYSFVTVVLSMIKIYSWRKWETLAGPIAAEALKARRTRVMRRQSTFVFHHASHPWSKNKVLIWMLCFLRQFKGSITRSDYLALRLGFVTYHKLPHSYDFHKYMVRSMEDDYNGTIGISWPLWVYAIICIVINVHGINIYFWLSFVPVVLVLLVGTELRHVIAQLALEVAEATAPYVGTQLKLRDDLFWFGKPRVLWWLIQFISFQNAFEMATFLWSLWELSEVQSCFMKHNYMIVIRLVGSSVLVQLQHTSPKRDHFSDGIQVQEVPCLGERPGVSPQLVQAGEGPEPAQQPAVLAERHGDVAVRLLPRHHLRDRPRDEHGAHAVADRVRLVAGRPAHRRHRRRRAVLHGGERRLTGTVLVGAGSVTPLSPSGNYTCNCRSY